MWCIGKLTTEYRQRMYDLLDLYARPYQENEPVVCVDEKSKQLLEQPRAPIPANPGNPIKEDYEYKRAGTRNIFMAIEPKGGHRQAEVTARRTKSDFVQFISHLVKKVYAGAQKIHLVLDNLNTHFRSSFEEVLGVKRATLLLERVEFHYTPKHASWLNMAEIEIGIMDRQCTGCRLPNEQTLRAEIVAWSDRRNQARSTIDWKFTRQDADQKLSRHYVS
jgi:transcription termination factor NusB